MLCPWRIQTDEITSIAATTNRNILQRGENASVSGHCMYPRILCCNCSVHACIQRASVCWKSRRIKATLTNSRYSLRWMVVPHNVQSIITFNRLQKRWVSFLFFFLSLVSLRVQNSSNRWRCLNFLLVVLSLAELLHWICYFLYKRKCDFSFLNLSTNHRKKYKWWFISLLRVVITRSIIHGLSRVSTLEHQM